MTYKTVHHMIIAHGGELIDRIARDRHSFAENALKYPVYNIADEDLAVFYRIADGTLSPLKGPMNQKDFIDVLDREQIVRDKKNLAWTIPIVFPITKEEKNILKPGKIAAIKDSKGVIIGTIEIEEVYRYDKMRLIESVYGSRRTDHPGPRKIIEDSRNYLISGDIWALPQLDYREYEKYMLSPRETRAMFKENGWERIVAFQTRNPLHRAHEYAMVYAMEKLSKEGHLTGVILNPLVGPTKDDDIPAEVRMRTYETLINNKLIGQGDRDQDYWDRQHLCDNLYLVGLDMKMFFAGPKEAVMHAIYRQNHGFTDIIIGRNHADAPYDDGTHLWGEFDAQEKFENLKLEIKPLNVGHAAYFEELGKVDFVEKLNGLGFREIEISGKELRHRLESEEPIDERIMRKPVVKILREAYRDNVGALRTTIKSSNITWHDSTIRREDREKRRGHKGACIWLTGLSASGKSTIANSLQSTLFEAGCSVYVLDGDNVRHGLNRDLGFSPHDREENIRRIAEVAKLLTEAGFIVITAFISPYKSDRDKARTIFPQGDFLEVYVKASIQICEKRDPKKLYKRARKGDILEFTGISAPYEEPRKPEIVIDTEHHSKEECVKAVVSSLIAHGILSEVMK